MRRTEAKPTRTGTEAKPTRTGTEAKPTRTGTEAKPTRTGTEAKPTRTDTEAKPGRPKAPLWARVAVIGGALLMLVSGGSVVAAKLLVLRYSSGLTHTGGLGAAAATDAAGRTTINGPINLLLVGIDERANNLADGARADSIIIAHVNAAHDSMYLTSIPRDTLVDIPPNKATGYTGGKDKINAAFEFGYQHNGGRDGGLALLAETISNLTAGRLKFNGAAIVNFDGFRDLVQAIGGVRMYVDEKVTSIHIGTNVKTGQEGGPYYINSDGTPGGLKPNMKPEVYDVGWHDFAPWQALDYVRQRDLLANNDYDYGRQRHQQQFIKAVLRKTLSTGVILNPLKVNAVLSSAGKAVSFYNNNIDIADWIFTLKDIQPDNMVMIKMNAGKTNTHPVNGIDYELMPPDGAQLLQAICDDNVQGFVASHMTWVGTDTG